MISDLFSMTNNITLNISYKFRCNKDGKPLEKSEDTLHEGSTKTGWFTKITKKNVDEPRGQEGIEIEAPSAIVEVIPAPKSSEQAKAQSPPDLAEASVSTVQATKGKESCEIRVTREFLKIHCSELITEDVLMNKSLTKGCKDCFKEIINFEKSYDEYVTTKIRLNKKSKMV